MAGIFPPVSKGGVPPGSNVCNGYTPQHPVLGEGPLYTSPNCTTALTDCQLNAIVSELLAAVDVLGYSYNATRVDNLGQALSAFLGGAAGALGGKVSKTGDTMTGPLILSSDPTNTFGAATKGYVDHQNSTFFATLTTNYQNADAAVLAQLGNKVSKGGDSMSGPLVLPGDPTQPLQAATKAYVDAHAGGGTGGGIAEAPTDGKLYGRVSGTWGIALPIAGGTLTGPLTLAADPTAPLGAATKAYVDAHSGGSGGGIADAPTNSSTYGRINASWQKVLNLAGGTLTGPLVLAADPTVALGAATKQYSDGKVLKTGDTMTGPLTVNMAAPAIVLKKTAGNAATITAQTGTFNRWVITLGDGTTEAGSNAGSNFLVSRYADNGALIDNPISINRATGGVVVYGNTQVGGVLGPPADAAPGTSLATGYLLLPYNTGRLGFNSYWAAGPTWKYITTGYASAFYQRSSDGYVCLDVANTGAAGAAVPGAGGTFNFTYAGSFLLNGGIVAGNQISSPATDSGSQWAFLGNGAYHSGANYSCPLIGCAPGAQNLGIYGVNTGTVWGIRLWTQSNGAVLDVYNNSIISYTAAVYKPGGGPWLDSSDERIKTVQGDYEHGLAEIEQIQPVRYAWRGNDTNEEPSNTPVGVPDNSEERPVAPYRNSPHYQPAADGTQYIGLIAQSVESILPELVKHRKGKIDGKDVEDLRELDTGPLIFALINAVKELSARVAALESKQ